MVNIVCGVNKMCGFIKKCVYISCNNYSFDFILFVGRF